MAARFAGQERGHGEVLEKHGNGPDAAAAVAMAAAFPAVKEGIRYTFLYGPRVEVEPCSIRISTLRLRASRELLPDDTMGSLDPANDTTTAFTPSFDNSAFTAFARHSDRVRLYLGDPDVSARPTRWTTALESFLASRAASNMTSSPAESTVALFQSNKTKSVCEDNGGGGMVQ